MKILSKDGIYYPDFPIYPPKKSASVLTLTFVVRGFKVVFVVSADALVEVGLVDERVHGLPHDSVDPEAEGGGHAVHEHEACQTFLPIHNHLQSRVDVQVILHYEL